MKNTVLEVAYIGSESHHLQYAHEMNPTLLLPSGLYGDPVRGTGVALQKDRVNPLYASLTAYQWGANADYNALQVTLKHRSASGLQFQAFYTYSKSIDEKSTIAGSDSRQEMTTILNPNNLAGDRSRRAVAAARQSGQYRATWQVVRNVAPHTVQMNSRGVRRADKGFANWSDCSTW